MPEQDGKITLDVPWAMGRLGVRKWLRERALHLPAALVPSAAARADQIARSMAQLAGVDTPTPEMRWRAVEQTMAELFGDGIERAVPPVKVGL